ncbi:hypothetical protein Droror1_Dr00004511 [Drosera rotundifolia]
MFLLGASWLKNIISFLKEIVDAHLGCEDTRNSSSEDVSNQSQGQFWHIRSFLGYMLDHQAGSLHGLGTLKRGHRKETTVYLILDRNLITSSIYLKKNLRSYSNSRYYRG